MIFTNKSTTVLKRKLSTEPEGSAPKLTPAMKATKVTTMERRMVAATRTKHQMSTTTRIRTPTKATEEKEKCGRTETKNQLE